MASIGVLAQLMQGMSPQVGVPQWNPVEEEQAQANLQGKRTGNETALLTLFDLKQKQASEAEVMAAIQKDPRLAQLLFGGGSTIGSLGQAPGAAPPTSLTQQTLTPGQPPGAPQTVPGGQDLSRFATQGGPPQSTIGSLGPAGQPPGPMQGPAPRNPVLEMAQRDPRAAMMLQQQIQGQQDRQWKIQEQHLDWGVKTAEFVARMIGNVKDQASLEDAREQVRQVHPQAAAQMPQFYSKEGIAALQQKGLAVSQLAEWRKNMATAQHTEMMTQQLPKVFGALAQFATGAGGTAQTPADTTAPTAPTPPATPAARASAGAVPGIENLSPQFRTKADTIADRLGANREDFYRVMHFETGGEMSPATTNRAGSGATGLIQFTPATAKGLGTTTAALAKMTPEQQLDYVERYLEPYKGKIGTLKDLYMAVLYPAALGKSEDTVLFSPDKTPAAYRQNAGLDAGNKGYVTVGDAVTAVERTTGGRARPASPGGATSTAQAPPPNPKIAQLRARIEQGNNAARAAELSGMEGPARQVRAEVNDLQRELERLEAPQHELAKQTVLQPGVLAQQRAGAEVQREAKQYEPIGIQAADELDLPASTLWKDVPKDRKPIPRPEKGERDALSGLRASVAGVDSLLTKLDDPKIAGMIGTIFSAAPAAVERLLGEWLPTLGPEQRAFAATIAGEIMEIRHRLIGAGQTGVEVEALRPMMPSTADTDPATVRAKLTALREGMLRRHNAKRDDLAGMGFRVPDKLAAPSPSASGLTADQQRLLDKHTTR